MIEITDVKKDPSLTDKFIEQSIPLVKTVVYRYFGQAYNTQDAQEYFQVGCIGLIKAVRKFNTDFNVKFSTYAIPVMVGEIRRYMRDYKFNEIKTSRKYTEAYFSYIKLKDSGLSDTEICQQMRVSTEKLKRISSSKPPEIKSINETVFTGRDGVNVTLEEFMSDPNDIEEKVIFSMDLIQGLKKIKSILSETDYLIFQYMLKKKSQKAIGEIVGLSQAHVGRKILSIRRVFKQIMNGEPVLYLNQSNKNTEKVRKLLTERKPRKCL